MKSKVFSLSGSRQVGVTLIELLIATVIGLFLVGGVVLVMMDGKRNFLMEDELAFIQENSRFALNHIAQDIRMAGFYGCGATSSLTNSIIDSNKDEKWMYSSNAIKGFEYSEKGDADFPTELKTGLLENTDVVIVNRADSDDSMLVQSAAGDKITLTAASEVKQGEILTIANPNCQSMAIFQATEIANSGKDIFHKTSSGTPGNCAIALTGYADCSGSPDPTKAGDTYDGGSSVMRFSSNAYYIKNSDLTGLPTLFSHSLTSSGSTRSQELVSGVEDFQILYGLDSDTTADGIVDQFYEAKDITQSGTLLWDRVVAVRVTLVFRSLRQVFAENTSVDLGEGYKYNDRYMRQRITQTVRIRNRGLEVSNAS